jgi:putative aldouronate transport system permease protein
LAAISGVNQELYESAYMDGAGRFKQMRHITLPGIKGTILLLFILGVSGIMGAGFDQLFNMLTPQTMVVGDILDTLIYRKMFSGIRGLSPAAAIGLALNIVGITLLLLANFVSTLLKQDSII